METTANKKKYYIHDECLLFKTRFLQTYKNVRFGRLIIFWRNFVYNRDDYFGTSTYVHCTCVVRKSTTTKPLQNESPKKSIY